MIKLIPSFLLKRFILIKIKLLKKKDIVLISIHNNEYVTQFEQKQ